MNSFFVFFFFSTAWYFLSKFPYTQVSFCFSLGKNASTVLKYCSIAFIYNMTLKNVICALEYKLNQFCEAAQ